MNLNLILNPNKTKPLVYSRTITVNHPHGNLVLSWVLICAILNLDIFGVKFDRRLIFEDHARGIVSHVSQRIGILRLVKRFLVDTCVAAMNLFSQSLNIVLRCGDLLLNVIFSFSSTRCIRWPGFALVRISCRYVIDVMSLHCLC